MTRVVSTIYIHQLISRSFFVWIGVCRSGSCEGASRRHRDIRVGVCSLGAARLVKSVLRLVSLELRVHIPSKLLSGRLRIVKLFLGLTLERLELLVEHLELFFLTDLGSCSLIGVNLGWLLCDCDHCIQDKQREEALALAVIIRHLLNL